jgi:hypothetical protein
VPGAKEKGHIRADEIFRTEIGEESEATKTRLPAGRRAWKLINWSLVVFWLFVAAVNMVQARTPKDFFQGSELSDGANYSPTGTPTVSNDVLLTSTATVLTLNGTNLSVGSVNQTSNLSYTVVNNNPDTADSLLYLGGGDGINTIGGDPADVIYLGCATCSLTFQGPNGGDGIGVLKLIQNQGAQFNVAHAGATLNIASDLFIDGHLTKVGSGTLNFSDDTITTISFATLTVNEGIVNFLPGAVINTPYLTLSVNNPNTGAGTAVTVNLQQSESFAGLGGTIAVPSAGTNTATVNLIGTGTTLGFGPRSANLSYPGTIAGEGNVSLTNGSNLGVCNQTFAGNNTYSGTTTIGSQCTLVIDGSTSGQGNYTVLASPSSMLPGTLSGGGTIGLNANGTITVGRNLAPGPASGIGTLHVSTSGTGGVIFGDGSIFVVRVSSMGLSDLLAIAGGSITLTSSSDTLSLSSLAGGFDGTDYTIATFMQNVGGGTFNTVQGLPSGYAVEYNPTSIRVVAIQQPLQLTSAVSRKLHGSAGSFDINLLASAPVECRSSSGNHTLVFTFSNYLTSGTAVITAGTGTVAGAPAFSGRTMTVNLTGVADVQTLVITLRDVTDRFSQVLPDTAVSMNMLIGDTNGNETVNAGDVAQTKSQSGHAVTAGNFRNDVNVSGLITASDVAQVKANSGHTLP